MQFQGYSVDGIVDSSDSTIVYRARSGDGDEKIIIKVTAKEYPSESELSRYRHEYEVLKSVSIDGVVDIVDLKSSNKGLALFFKDFGGTSLSTLIKTDTFPLMEKLSIMRKVTDIVGRIHENKIIHKDINPSNIIYNRKDSILKIIDFGIADKLTSSQDASISSSSFEGTLAYMAPEQTGRINRKTDYRSDLYSLGATFYEILTGNPPFVSDDPMEFIHSHIAKTPIPPVKFNEDIPDVVSAIVMKLLSKDPEDRYQSAAGLSLDFQNVIKALEENGAADFFTLAERDISTVLNIPSKLYGREKQISLLMNVFERVSEGRSEIVLVNGYAGVGKSSLVMEIHKPVVKHRGYFIQGKFDQYKRDVPYSSFISAFKEMIRLIMVESEENIDFWKEKILSAVGVNGKVILEVIPELESIIGLQPEIPDLPPEESKNRFKYTFKNFVKAISTKEHPLVIFFDDLQWADSASLELIHLLTTDSDLGYALIIGASREEDLNRSESTNTLKEIAKDGGVITEIKLTPLEIRDVVNLLSDTVQCDKKNVTDLAELCYKKTAGNPFFLNQFINMLYEEDLIHLNISLREWKWNLKNIMSANFTDNVIDFMIQKIGKVDSEAQEMLKKAACISSEFDLKMLSIVAEKSEIDVAESLWQCMSEGLILPVRGVFTISALQNIDINFENAPVYKFVHDRVMQAAYSMIAEEKRKELHLKIFRLMNERISTDVFDEKLFDIVNQLNYCRELIDEDDERYLSASIYLKAGIKAKSSAAYNTARNCFTSAVSLLNKKDWEQKYELTRDVYLAAAEAEYLCTDLESMENLVSTFLENAKTKMDIVKIYEVRVRGKIASGDRMDAIKDGIDILKKLGVKLKLHPTKLDVLFALIKTRISFMLSGKSLENPIEMTDSDKLATMKFFSLVGPSAYVVEPNLTPLIILKLAEFSVRYGQSRFSAFAHVTYGYLLTAYIGDLENGYKEGVRGLEVADKYDVKGMFAKSRMLFGCYIQHYRHHAKDAIPILFEGYYKGLDAGDFEFAAYDILIYLFNSFVTGKNLDELRAEINKYEKEVYQIKQTVQLRWIRIYHQMSIYLIDGPHKSGNFEGSVFKESEMLPDTNEDKDKTAVFNLLSSKMIVNFIYDKLEIAQQNGEEAEKNLHYVIGSFDYLLFPFNYSYVLLGMYESVDDKRKKEILRKVKKYQKKAKPIIKSAPENYLHKYRLVEALLADISGDILKAINLFDEAIKLAGENGFIMDEAVANEFAAKFYVKRGKEKTAKIYFTDAFYLYRTWGAVAKSEKIIRDHKDFILLDMPSSFSNSYRTTITHFCADTTIPDASATLDFKSLLKASMTVSMEIVLDKLLENLMRIIVENAGAQNGVLILKNGKKFLVESEWGFEDNSVKVLRSIHLDEYQNIPKSIVNYVIRSKESVVLDNAAEHNKYSNDEYIKKYSPKSVVCAPLIKKGEITGVYYLENNAVANSFTQDRLEVLNILSSQAAISIENAYLYHSLEDTNKNLEQKVKERTMELSDAYEKIKHLAMVDSLTGLPNRRNILEKIEHEKVRGQRSQKPFSVIIGDIDFFKKFNDTYGHDCGDFVLKKVADTIKKSLRKQDYVARWGGEEFLLILPETDGSGSVVAAEQVRKSVEESNLIYKDVPLNITMTFGTSTFNFGDDFEEKLKAADEALYEGKESGRNRVVLSSSN